MDVYEALSSRRSVRGYRPDPVPEAVLRRVLEACQRAPSWCNIQPWRVWITSGEATRRLTAALRAQAASGAPPAPDFPFPVDYPPPYDALRRRCGATLYGAMGVARDDRVAREAAWLRNYEAFAAPHVAIVGVDRRFGLYGALDVGCWLQSFLLAATAEGLAACAQASLASYPDVLRAHLPLPEEVGVLCGVALGLEDPAVPANGCVTERQPLEANVTFAEDR